MCNSIISMLLAKNPCGTFYIPNEKFPWTVCLPIGAPYPEDLR